MNVSRYSYMTENQTITNTIKERREKEEKKSYFFLEIKKSRRIFESTKSTNTNQ
jgi:hypothetical protein